MLFHIQVSHYIGNNPILAISGQVRGKWSLWFAIIMVTKLVTDKITELWEVQN